MEGPRMTRRQAAELWLEMQYARRDEMEHYLRTRRAFSRAGARRAVDNYLETMRYVVEETGTIPTPAEPR
jgi:hypothetical protein